MAVSRTYEASLSLPNGADRARRGSVIVPLVEWRDAAGFEECGQRLESLPCEPPLNCCECLEESSCDTRLPVRRVRAADRTGFHCRRWGEEF